MTAKQELEEAIADKMQQRGMTRERACAAVFKENPDLRERLIAEANDGPRAA